MERSEAMGRVFVIDSTCYFHNEILDIGFSVCNGMLADGSEFRFRNGDIGNYKPLDLGCISYRNRNEVIMSKDDLVRLAERHLEREKNEYSNANIHTKKGCWFAEFINKYCIKLQRCTLVEDKWTGKKSYHHYNGFSTYNFPALGDYCDNRSGRTLYFVTDDFDKAIDKIAEWIEPLFVNEEALA